MTDQLPRPAPAGDLLVDSSPLHLATPEDLADVADRDQRFAELLARGDDRDRAAERRDRAAEADEAAADPTSAGSTATGRGATVTRPLPTART